MSSTDSLKLFDGFFWIASGRSRDKPTGKKSSVLWNYPDDVEYITKNFMKIPNFCFPDLDRMHLERAEQSQSENFTFTLTDSSGGYMYGICFRSLFRGKNERYDVGRRLKHCLCIITRLPYFSYFRVILMQVHALSLLNDKPDWSRFYLDQIYKQYAAMNKPHSSILIRIEKGMVPDLMYPLIHPTPRYRGLRINRREVSVIQLLEVLGAEKFLRLLSMILCEQRILFVADSIGRLTSSVLAAASMIAPFSWQRIFIPLLPPELLDYVGAPMPFLIGVHRQLLPLLEDRYDTLGNLVIVDADSGYIKTIGNVTTVDFIGESGSAFKQASESFNIVKAKASNMANILFGKSSLLDDDESNEKAAYSGSKDIVANILADLKSLLNSKPGGNSIQAVTSGLLRGGLLTGAGKNTEEARIDWIIEGEKVVRDCLTSLFVYLFATLDDEVNVNATKRSPSGQIDYRVFFDLKSFAIKRQQLGDSKEIIRFLDEFIQSQMFERFCYERFGHLSATKSNGFGSSLDSNSSAMQDEDEDVYNAIVSEMRNNRIPFTVASIKQIVPAKTSTNENNNDKGTKLGRDYHLLTIKQTSADSNITIDRTDRIIIDSYDSNHFLKIMKTIAMRLHTAVASGCRGSSGMSGYRSLILLRDLLIQGPSRVLSYALDFIPAILNMIRLSEKHQQHQSTAVNALEFIMQGGAVDCQDIAHSALELLLDHRKIKLQKKMAWLKQNNSIPFALLSPNRCESIKASSSVSLDPSIRFIGFGKLHTSFKPSLARIPEMNPSKLRLTVVTKIVKEEGDNDEDDVDTEENANNEGNLLDISPVNRMQKGHDMTTTTNTTAATPSNRSTPIERESYNILPPPPSAKTAKPAKPAELVSLLDDPIESVSQPHHPTANRNLATNNGFSDFSFSQTNKAFEISQPFPPMTDDLSKYFPASTNSNPRVSSSNQSTTTTAKNHIDFLNNLPFLDNFATRDSTTSQNFSASRSQGTGSSYHSNVMQPPNPFQPTSSNVISNLQISGSKQQYSSPNPVSGLPRESKSLEGKVDLFADFSISNLKK